VRVKYLMEFQQNKQSFFWNILISFLSLSNAVLIVSICNIGFSCFVIF
jgi:hypothetical protein